MPTNKKVIVVGIIIAMLLIVFGGYWYMQNQDTTTEPASTDTSDQMMEDNGQMEDDSKMAMNDGDADDAAMMKADSPVMEDEGEPVESGKRSRPAFMIDSWATVDPGQNYILTFNADGTYTVELAEEIEDQGTWYVENNTSLVLESDLDPDLSMSFDYVSTDDSQEFLYLTNVVAGEEFEFTFERTKK